MQVLASWGGWLMDGYTTITYALVAVIIAPVFFPSSLKSLAIVLTFAGFAVTAMARSVGSLLIGNFLGDKLGRRQMLIITILFFSLFSAFKGLLPGYLSIGIAAPVLLYAFLFIEGMFAGAEYGGGTSLSMESIPPERRNFIGSFVQSGFGLGYFTVAFVFAGLSSYFGPSSFAFIGWRILFLTALIPGALTILIRAFTSETEVFKNMKKSGEIEKVPLAGLFKEAPRTLILSLLITTGLLAVNTATFSFYPGVMELRGGFTGSQVGVALGIINFVSLFGVWIGGALGNTINGRKKPMLVYSLIFLMSIYFILKIGFSAGFGLFIVMFSVQAFIEAMIFSTLPAFLSEQFSKKFRTTAVGFSYNGGGIVGGFAISIILVMSNYVGGILNAWMTVLFLFSIIMVIGIALSKETWKRLPDGNMEDAITQ